MWHAYSTSTCSALSNDTKVNDLVTLTMTFMLKIAFSDFVASGVFHKYIFFISENILNDINYGTLFQ